MSDKQESSIELVEEDVDNTQVTLLPPKQQRFIHMYLTGQYTIPKIADLLDVHPNTVKKWLRHPDVKMAMEEQQVINQNIVSTHLKALTMKATSRLMDLMDSPIDGVALQAVKDVLDRAGHKAKQEIKVDKTVTTIEEKMRELIDSTIVDADFDIIEGD